MSFLKRNIKNEKKISNFGSLKSVKTRTSKWDFILKKKVIL